MESERDVLIRMELKYCEACGGLWFRYTGSEEVYCARCLERMSQIVVGRSVAHA